MHAGSTDDNAPPAQRTAEDIHHQCKTEIESLKMECDALRAENFKLKDMVQSVSFDEMSLKDNDEKVNSLTGIPTYQKLFAIYTFCFAIFEGKQ